MTLHDRKHFKLDLSLSLLLLLYGFLYSDKLHFLEHFAAGSVLIYGGQMIAIIVVIGVLVFCLYGVCVSFQLG